MPNPIIETKISVPPLPAANVSRPRLIAQLNRGLQLGHRLLSVAAPAGYGKTTLLCEWASQSGPARFSWLALDDGDNDPAQFWNYLAGALGRHIPNLLEPIQTLLQGDPLRQLPTDLLLAVLINTVAPETQPVVLVLDDYHVIHNERIHAALIQLLARAPANLHLAVTSRSEPPLELARLRARSQLTEIQMDALSFSENESAAFLNAAMRLALSEVDVAALNRRAEGWIAGLQLAAVAMQAARECLHVIAGIGVELKKYPETQMYLNSSLFAMWIASLVIQLMFRFNKVVQRSSAHGLGDVKEVSVFFYDLLNAGREQGLPMPAMSGFEADIRKFAGGAA